MGFLYFFLFFFLFHPFLLKFADSKCQKSFTCKHLPSDPMEFPLTDPEHPECGLIKVNCNSEKPLIQLTDDGIWYDVFQRLSTNRYVIATDPFLRPHLFAETCASFTNMSLRDSPSISFNISSNLTLFKCHNFVGDQESIRNYFKNYEKFPGCRSFTLYYRRPEDGNLMEESNNIPEGCSVIKLPMNSSHEDSNDLFKLLSPRFSIEWTVSKDCLRCHSGGGRCVTNGNNKFECKKGKSKTKVILAAGGVIALLIASIILFVLIWKKNGWCNKLGLTGAKTENQKEIENFLKNNGNLSPRRYKYSELKKITKSFSDKLGKGGYGSVYKGKLHDGSLVAVKILNELTGNGEEFMNEVASISRTSHVNIVTLLGFCFEGSKRALIYEFLPNGSLEKYIPNTCASSTAGLLGWEKLFEIIVGIARGLEYLHQGCNMRILHFDIKPHNVLLDKELKPKISDFGLAKLCPNRSSIVSMLGARGTAGYIAPEVFCRNFGQVSHKSDVYSYGMMVLEMVLGRKNIEPQADSSSEMYFPDWIYKNLEQNVETSHVDSSFMEGDEWQIAKKKVIIIGLCCIQTEPKNRPSISRVIEMLEGKVESLQVPPRPYLSSPPRLIAIFSASDSI